LHQAATAGVEQQQVLAREIVNLMSLVSHVELETITVNPCCVCVLLFMDGVELPVTVDGC
jgi:hypothetical protein